MPFPKALPLAALLLTCTAMAGFYASATVAATLDALPACETDADAAVPDPASIESLSDTRSDIPTGTPVCDYPGKPEPVLISPIARAVAASRRPQAPSLGSLIPPDIETAAQRSLRRSAEAAAGIAGIFAKPECRPSNPVTLVLCDDYPPAARR